MTGCSELHITDDEHSKPNVQHVDMQLDDGIHKLKQVQAVE